MDPMQIIILSSIVNIVMTGLIGGIVIYVIQKKIDATIQKSLFEHQIKFSRVYPKTLEVLEGYNQKILECSRRSNALASRIVLRLPSENPRDAKELFKKEYSDLSLAVHDANVYFQNNRIHFSDAMVHDLNEIHDRATALSVASQTSVDALGTSLEAQIEHFKRSSRLLGLSLDQEVSEELALGLLLLTIREEFYKLLNRLEKLYRSVADAKES